MKNQIDILKIPFPITFFEAYTPVNSKEYVIEHPQDIKEIQCSLRSHIAALKQWLNSSTNEYVLILEDDVRLIKENFLNQLNNVIRIYNSNRDIDYISIGYLPRLDISGFAFPLDNISKKRDENVYWNFNESRYTIWGAQAMLFRRSTVQKIVSLLFHENISQLVNTVKNHLKRYPKFQRKELRLTTDAFLPMLFSQGIVFPPMAVEKHTRSTINTWDDGSLHSKDLYKFAQFHGFNLNDYYDSEDC